MKFILHNITPLTLAKILIFLEIKIHNTLALIRVGRIIKKWKGDKFAVGKMEYETL